MKLKDAIKLIKRNKDRCCFITRPHMSDWVNTHNEQKHFNVNDLLATDWLVKIDNVEIG